MIDGWQKCERCGTLVTDCSVVFEGITSRAWWERLGAARVDGTGRIVGDALIVHTPDRCTKARARRL